jgi:hypothetical protein
MSEEEKKVEKKEITEDNLLDEINNAFSKSSQDGFGDYTQEMQRIGYSPDNPYGHAWSLISSPKKNMKTSGLDVLNDPQILLGFIENEKSLRLYQMDIYYLTHMCNMGLHDPMFAHIFAPLWQNFKNEVRVTSAMGGSERQYQAFTNPQPPKSKGFSLFGKRKKKREPIDLIFPQDDEESMY